MPTREDQARRADEVLPESVAVLLVDDHAENLLALEAILDPLGHTFVRASSGEEALRRVLETDFAVILLDVQMPGLDGFETARLIKGRHRNAHTPIIFLTALRAGQEYVAQGYATGAVDYMAKPFEPDILRAKVSAFVELYLKTQAVERQAERLRWAERREAELRHRAELLEAERDANHVKTEFLATMSHELRTPLNAVIGYAALLRSGIPEPLPAKSTAYVERIEVSAQQLLGVINEILTFSRIQAGDDAVERAPVRLFGVVRDVHAIVEPAARQKGIALRIQAPHEGMVADTDSSKLRQILANLLGNAVKYTDRGEVALETEVTMGGEVIFRVRDTGVGIAPQHLERIWEPFWQAEGGSTRRVGGTGLGLTVSRRLARLLGGDLALERTEVGQGTTFAFRLPLSPGTGRLAGGASVAA